MENTTGNNEQVKQNWMAKTYQFHRYELNLKQHGFDDERHTTAVDADGGVTALAFKQGDVAIVNSNDGTVKKRLEADQPQGMCINDLRVLARGQKIATGGGSKNVNVWDVETGQLETGLEGHSGEVSVVRGNARALISASSTDDCINIWDLRKKVSTKTLYPAGSVVAMEYFQTPAFTLITGLAHSVRVWDLRKTGEVLKEFSVGGCLRCMALNPSHDRVVIGSSDKNGNGILTVASTSTWDVVHAVREMGPRNLKFKAVFNVHVDEYKIVAGTQNANEGAAAGNIHIFNSAGDISESPQHVRTLTELHGGYQNSVCVKGANMWGVGDSNSYEPATSQLLKWDFS